MSFIDRINKKDDSILLEFFDGEHLRVKSNKDLPYCDKTSKDIRIAVLDVESTGFDVENDILHIPHE